MTDCDSLNIIPFSPGKSKYFFEVFSDFCAIRQNCPSSLFSAEICPVFWKKLRQKRFGTVLFYTVFAFLSRKMRKSVWETFTRPLKRFLDRHRIVLRKLPGQQNFPEKTDLQK